MGLAVLTVALVVLAFPAVYCAVQSNRAPYFAGGTVGGIIGGVIGIFYAAVMFDTYRNSMDEFEMGLAFVLMPILMGVVAATVGAYAGAAVVSFYLGTPHRRERMIMGAVIGLVPGVLLAMVFAPHAGSGGYDRALGAAVALLLVLFWPLAFSLIGALTCLRKT